METSTFIILAFFLAHWWLCVFFQTFYQHRYAAHQMFRMSPGWERFFYLSTYLAQGSSFLSPRGYAILHRMHHAFSDTGKDPHSPRNYGNVAAMMLDTKKRYDAFAYRLEEPEPRFAGGYPEWPALDRFSQSWVSRAAWAAAYTAFYIAVDPAWWLYLLLPIHFVMGPIHGAIVNWCGHRYGYRNFDTHDDARNMLAIDFLTAGELYQNNHHKLGKNPNFAVRWFELDPAFQVMRILDKLGVIELHPAPASP